MITTSDSLQFLTTKQEHEFNILYADPPYALGSSVIVRPDGKVDYHKASDFMSKWEMPTGDYWDKWFKEAHRVLKNGGWLIMFGIDRQLLLFKYYALLAGFEEQQSLYWYFISNFPKATDLSKMIEKNAGVEVKEGVGFRTAGHDGRPIMGDPTPIGDERDKMRHIAQTELGKKYDGYKYSISPLKQTNETIMIFKKPSKTGSVLHDTLAFENGDTTINVSALNIDGNRVGVGTGETKKVKYPNIKGNNYNQGNQEYENRDDVEYTVQDNGRYPAQTFINDETAKILDEQSGIEKSTGGIRNNKNEIANTYNDWNPNVSLGHDGLRSASKILHKCNYEQDDLTLYHYEPKVSGSERNAGLGGFDPKLSAASEFRPNHLEKTLNGENGNPYGRWKPLQNNHPTLKPIELNYRILKLFKLPTDQKICYPFAGSGSEIIGGIKAGFENWVGCEINAEYVAIANARINYWKETMWEQQSLFDEVI
jgi:DNA modification methylase